VGIYTIVCSTNCCKGDRLQPISRRPPFCTFAACKISFSKTARTIFYTRPADKGVTHYTLLAKCVADFPSALPSARVNFFASAQIYLLLVKAFALNIYPQKSFSDKYIKASCRIGKRSRFDSLLFL